MKIEDRIAGGLLGLLIGDALGGPCEFKSASEIPPTGEIEFSPPAGFPGRTRARRREHGPTTVRRRCVLLASLLHANRFDPRDFGKRLVDWLDHGYLAVGDRVFDVGIQTGLALDALRAGVPPLGAGRSGERENGNGSLMRSLPLALWHRGPDAALVHDATLQSRVTHAHPRSMVCCGLYVLWARRTLEGSTSPWADAVSAARRIWLEGSAFRSELESHLLPAFSNPPAGTGYVVDSLRAAVSLLEHDSFEAIARGAISLGDDTDTTACIACGIAGIRFGIEGIPLRWRDRLRGMELVRPLLDALVARRAGFQ